MIPTFISQLVSLEVLIASHNKLISLPEEMGVLDKLMEIVSINRKNKTKVSKNCNTNVIHKIVILM